MPSTKTTKTTAAPAAKTTKHHRTIFGEANAATVMAAIKAQKGQATAMSLEVAPSFMTRMQKAGLVKITGKVKSEKRGRPAHYYGLTDKGRRFAAKA
jgi:DNA-binding PadR family transcriptional regulator